MLVPPAIEQLGSRLGGSGLRRAPLCAGAGSRGKGVCGRLDFVGGRPGPRSFAGRNVRPRWGVPGGAATAERG